MHGFTDTPPHVLSGHQLFRSWYNDGRQYEWHAPDGSFVLYRSMLDFDYLVGYLLEVRDPTDTTSDHLLCFKRHGGDNPRDYIVSWRNRPTPIFTDDEDERDEQRLAVHAFVEFCYAEVEAYSEELRRR